MSSTSLTHKIKALGILNNRNFILIILAALVTTLVVISTVAIALPATKPFDHNAYMLYRQGEWLSVPIPVSNAEAYQIFRRGEVDSPLSNVDAYQLYRKGEVMSPVVLTNAEAYLLYRRGEWSTGPVDAIGEFRQEELLLYNRSANSSIGGAAFYEYRRGEWAGN